MALDTNGNLVIIELKKGKLKDPAEIQALRYASYVSRWSYEDIEKQAQAYFAEKGDRDFNFNEKFEEFCTEAGVEEIPDINQDQRIILVGSKVKEKLGSVALWLREHSVDIKVVEVSLFKDGDNLLLSPNVIIPLPTTEKFEIGKHALRKDRPWLSDGEKWHLEKRCGKEMKKKLTEFVSLIKENEAFRNVEGPYWNQKLYVSFKESGRIWIYINTHKNPLVLNVFVKKDEFNASDVAKLLGIKLFDRNSPLSEKLQMESSVEVINRGALDKIRIRIKNDFDIRSEKFEKFIKDCLSSFKRI